MSESTINQPVQPSVGRIRLRTSICLVGVVALGLGLKSVEGPWRPFLAHWASSIPYEMFFMLAAFLVWPRRRLATRIAVIVCLSTIALEFGQLYREPWIQQIRAHRLGMLVLGNRFHWTDLPAYPIGCAIGWFVLRWLSRPIAQPDGSRTTET